MQPIQMHLFQKQKPFLNCFEHIWNLLQILNIFKQNMTLIADLFPKLRTPKKVVRSMS